jgi:hypothetical protein
MRLDRAFACPKWSSMFPQADVTHIVSSRANHCPILLDLDNKRKGRKTTKTQRYEMMWEREEFLLDEINTAWEGHVSAGNLQEIHQKLKSTMVCLKDWSTKSFGAVSKEIADLKTKLERLLENQNSSNSKDIEAINKRLDELLLREEIMWRQRSRTNWLPRGPKHQIFPSESLMESKKEQDQKAKE